MRTSSLSRRLNIGRLSREISSSVCDYAYRQPVDRQYEFFWAKERTGRERGVDLTTIVSDKAIVDLGVLLDTLTVRVYITHEDYDDPEYDNNFYYGELSIELTLPLRRSVGQAYLTGNLHHELTHAQQMRVQGDRYEGVGPRDPVGYALNPDEVEAHTKEFLRRSRGLRKPLGEVVKDHWDVFFEGNEANAQKVTQTYLKHLGLTG